MTLSRPNNLVLALAGALLLALFVALQWTRLPLVGILVIPLVLFLPGYALSAALLGGNAVSGAERFLWSMGLSIAIAILCGLLLALTPWGLQTTTWVILLLAVTILAGGFALVRGYGSRTVDRRPFDALRTSATNDRARFSLTLGDIVLVSFALLAIVVALQIARVPAPASSVNGYTSLWVLPPSDTSTHMVNFGFTSQETEPVIYELVLDVNGKPAQIFPNITLQPGDKWMNVFDATNVAPDAQIAAVLYRMDESNVVYRSVVLNPK